MSGYEAVFDHSFHVLLDDGFHLTFHLGLFCHLTFQVAIHPIVFQGIDANGLLTIELQHVIAFAILIDAIQIIDGPSVFRRRIQQVASKGHVGFVVTHEVKDGGEDVSLLGDALADAWGKRATGIVDDDGGTELVDAGLLSSP